MTGFEIKNGTTTVKNSPEHSSRCVDVSTHVCGRDVEAGAVHWPARDKSDENGERDAYISFTLTALEASYEVPSDERDSFRRRSTEQVTYLDIEDARALRDALTVALDCADVK